MDEIRGSLLVRNTLINITGQLIPLIVGVLTIPFIIRGLGIERYGILSLAWVVLSYFSLFNLGLGSATTKFVAESLGSNKTEVIPGLVWTSVILNIFFGVIGCLILAIITPVLVEQILNIPDEITPEAIMSFYILSALVPIVFLTVTLRGVLEAKQRFGLVNLVKIPTGAFTFLIPLVALPLGLPGIMLFLLLTWTVAAAVYLVFCLVSYPGLGRAFTFNPRVIKPLLFYGGWTTVASAAGPVLLYLERFLLATFLAMTAVTYYAAPHEIVSRLGIFSGSLMITLFPTFSALGHRRKETVGKLYIRAMKYSILVTGPIVLIIVLFSSEIIGFWLGDDFVNQSNLVFKTLAIGALFSSLSPISGSLLQGLGRPDLLAKVYLVEIPLNIVLAWILIKYIGIEGAALSFAFRSIVETSAFMVLSSKIIGLRASSLIKNGLLRSSSAVLGFGGLLWIISIGSSNLLTRTGFAFLAVTVFILATWGFVLDRADKRALVTAAAEVTGYAK